MWKRVQEKYFFTLFSVDPKKLDTIFIVIILLFPNIFGVYVPYGISVERLPSVIILLKHVYNKKF